MGGKNEEFRTCCLYPAILLPYFKFRPFPPVPESPNLKIRRLTANSNHLAMQSLVVSLVFRGLKKHLGVRY